MKPKYCIAAIKALIQNGSKFLVLEQKLSKGIIWDLPGGKIEYGEDPIEALHREVAEETGLSVKIIKPLGCFWFIHSELKEQVVCTTYLCESNSQHIDITQNPAVEPVVGWRWVSRNEFINSSRLSHESMKELFRHL